MRPDPTKVLMSVTNRLFVQVMPEVRTPFGQWTASMSGALNLVLAQEFDRIADRLHEENEAVAALLVEAAPLLADAELAARAVAAAEARTPANLRVSTLQEVNDRLRAVLIDVHVAIEETDGDAARAMDERIWAEYLRSTQRRHVEIPR